MSYVVFGVLAEISLTVYATASVCGKNGALTDIYSFYKAIKSKYAILLLILRANRMEYEQDFEN